MFSVNRGDILGKVNRRYYLALSFISLGLSALLSGALAASDEEKHHSAPLNVYNWNDYIAADTVSNFEQQTGINVKYDLIDSNEVLDARLLSGKSGFDVVVPSDSFLSKQIQAGAFQPLDKTKLTNLANLNPELMNKIKVFDPDNIYSIPYMWGTTGIGYNPDKVKTVLGDVTLSSWSMVFDPEVMVKLSQCGVAFSDAPSDMMPAALNYLGLSPNSTSPDDFKKAEALLTEVAPYVLYYHNSKYVADLANGDICVAVGWSGDVLQAANRADEAGNGVRVEYLIPKEGAQVWFDMLAIPIDAPNPDQAHQFINYLLEPQVIADITNYVWYANPNDLATGLIDKEIRANQGIYPDAEVMAKLYIHEPLPKKAERLVTRSWNRVKYSQ